MAAEEAGDLGGMMRTKTILAILILGISLLSAFACGDPGPPEATPTATPTPTQCEADRDAIQTALYAYHDEKGEWPTETGGPGDIEWEKLVPSFLASIPTTDDNCDWSVSSDPEGDVCVGPRIGCISCKCRCGTRCAE